MVMVMVREPSLEQLKHFSAKGPVALSPMEPTRAL